MVDGTGDPNNLTFGALHRYGTSSYSRIGAGNVVGLPKSQRIDRAVSDSKGLILSNHADGSLGKKDRLALWRPIHDETRELRIRPGKLLGSDFTTSPDYVSLEAAWSVKRRRGDAQSHINPSVSSDGCETDYRSVEAEAKMKSEPADQDLIYDSDASIAQDDDGSSPLNQEKLARETMIQLSRRVEVEPSNYDAWLNMINHQDKMLGLGHRKSSTIAERRSIAEIKASIYEKALVRTFRSHYPQCSNCSGSLGTFWEHRLLLCINSSMLVL